MRLKVKRTREQLLKEIVDLGISCTGTFLKRSPDQSCKKGIIVIGILDAQYKLPDTTQFNI